MIDFKDFSNKCLLNFQLLVVDIGKYQDFLNKRPDFGGLTKARIAHAYI